MLYDSFKKSGTYMASNELVLLSRTKNYKFGWLLDLVYFITLLFITEDNSHKLESNEKGAFLGENPSLDS